MQARSGYEKNVFINCPFDDEYRALLDAMVFAIHDCGFVPCCALEESDGGDVRLDKIKRLVQSSRYGIHDISRTELDDLNGLPQFMMKSRSMITALSFRSG